MYSISSYDIEVVIQKTNAFVYLDMVVSSAYTIYECHNTTDGLNYLRLINPVPCHFRVILEYVLLMKDDV